MGLLLALIFKLKPFSKSNKGEKLILKIEEMTA